MVGMNFPQTPLKKESMDKRKIGRPIRDVSYPETLNVKMNVKILERVRAMVKDKGITLSAYIRGIIVEKLTEYDSEAKDA